MICIAIEGGSRSVGHRHLRAMRGLLLGVVVAGTAGCMARLPRMYSHEQVEPPLAAYWSYERTASDRIVAAGVLRNSFARKFRLTQFSVTLFGLDGAGNVRSSETTRLPDFAGWQMPFRAGLSLRGSEERFMLRFTYKVEDDETNGNGRN